MMTGSVDNCVEDLRHLRKIINRAIKNINSSRGQVDLFGNEKFVHNSKDNLLSLVKLGGLLTKTIDTERKLSKKDSENSLYELSEGDIEIIKLYLYRKECG